MGERRAEIDLATSSGLLKRVERRKFEGQGPENGAGGEHAREHIRAMASGLVDEGYPVFRMGQFVVRNASAEIDGRRNFGRLGVGTCPQKRIKVKFSEKNFDAIFEAKKRLKKNPKNVPKTAKIRLRNASCATKASQIRAKTAKKFAFSLKM